MLISNIKTIQNGLIRERKNSNATMACSAFNCDVNVRSVQLRNLSHTDCALRESTPLNKLLPNTSKVKISSEKYVICIGQFSDTPNKKLICKANCYKINFQILQF